MNDTIYSLTLAAACKKQGTKQNTASQITGASMMSTGPVVVQHNVPHSARGNAGQPKFIRKKPQVIHSIEFSEGGIELKPDDATRQSNLFVDDDQLRLAEPPPQEYANKCSTTPKSVKHNILKSPTSAKKSEHNDEQLLLTKMMDELKQKKQQEIMLKSTSTLANDEVMPAPQITSSPENMKNKERRPSVSNIRSKSPQNREYEVLKLKKIEELKQAVIKERQKSIDKKGYISGASLMQQPYQTTVSKDNDDDGYKSESTVHYMNESTQNIKRQSLSASKPKQAQRKKSKSRTSKPVSGAFGKSTDVKQNDARQEIAKSASNMFNPQSNSIQNPYFQPSQFEPPHAPSNQRQINQASMIDLTPIKNHQILQQTSVPRKNLEIASPRTHFDQEANTNFHSQNQHLTEKTQQIFFKKLQKDVEMAIRSADVSEKGSLTMEELKHCFFFMDYLPFIQMEMGQGTTYPRFGNPRNHITTNKGLVLQEKEFVYNFWCSVNPLNQPEIDNALTYDILLLMIYNIQQPVNVSVASLSEYLEKLYRELNIELEQYSNFNSNTSHSQSTQPQQLSNVSRYLSFSNLWSIEKLIHEFRQIHANKVSNVFSTNRKGFNQAGPQQVKFTLSPSNTAHSPSQNILINPADGRKYKKLVVEEHLSNLTFSPVINDKTKKLDQKVTQRLLQESSRSRSRGAIMKRDVSADDVKNRNSFFRPTDQMANSFSNNQAIDQENDTEALNHMKRYDLLVYRQQVTEEKIQKAKENKLQQMLSECTFQPSTNNQRNGLIGSKSFQNLNKQTHQTFQDITQKIRSQKQKLVEQAASTQNLRKGQAQNAATFKLEKEIQECTFKPQINSHTPRQTHSATDKIPKGYYEMINRIRKVTEEKKAMEEKIQKKVIGENYDKVKLMNLKPPSFLNEEDKKQKKKLLMYIDVNINPTKTGRIGIYEGDDIKDLVKNFQKTFQLNKLMVHLLTQQLEQHLKKHYERVGLQYNGSSVFPSHQSLDTAVQNNQNTQSTYSQMHYLPMTLQENEFESIESRGGINTVKFAQNMQKSRQQDLEDFPHQQIPGGSMDVSSFHYANTQSNGVNSGQFLPFQSHQTHLIYQQDQTEEEELENQQESDAVSYRKEHNSLNIHNSDQMLAPPTERKSNIETELYSQIFSGVKALGKSDLAQFSLQHNNESFY